MSARDLIEAAGKTDAYLSIVLDEPSRLRVQALAVHPNVYGDHVTVAYQPTEEQLQQLRPQVGKWFKFEATAMVQDSKGQALRVTGVPSLNAHPHVTVSCAEGVEPVYSNELLAKEHGQPKTVRLAGRLEESTVGGVEEAEEEYSLGDKFEFGDNYWIDPDGGLRSTEGSEHLEWAAMTFGEDVDPTAEGWRRVTTSREPDGRKVIFISDARPNRAQRAALERAAIENEAWLILDRGTRRGMGTRPETVLYQPPAVEEALKIRVPPFAQSAFFQDHGAPEEFWAMKARPKTRAGDAIEFFFGSKPVATAKVSRVEEPGQSACGHSGKFGAKWKVHWKDASFRRVSESDENAPVVGVITWDGDVRFLQTWQSHREARLGRGFAWRYAPSTSMVYWWDGDGRTTDREEMVAAALEDAGYAVKGHADMLPYASDEESKNWNAAHATHWRSQAVIEDAADAYQSHDAPSMGEGGGSPLHNVVGAYPEDVYSGEGLRYYSTGHRLDPQGYSLVQSYRNRPNRAITVYRAVPKNVQGGINPGDWVTPIRAYATEHGNDNLMRNFRIVSKLVHARDLFTSGNSWLEWGYDPQPFDQESERLKRERRAAKAAGAQAVIEAVTGSPSSLYRAPADPEQEHIVSAAVKSRMTGDVFLGDDHAHAFVVADEAGSGISQNSAFMGFWTNLDRFVTRAEALEIARAQKQRGRARFSDDAVHSVELMSAEAEKSLEGRW